MGVISVKHKREKFEKMKNPVSCLRKISKKRLNWEVMWFSFERLHLQTFAQRDK